MSERPMLCAPDWIQGSDSVTTYIGGGSWDATQDITKVATDDVNDMAISSSTATDDTQWHVDLSVGRDVRAAIITDHNIDNDGLVRIRGSNTNAWAGGVMTVAFGGGLAGQETGGIGFSPGMIVTEGPISTLAGQVIKFSGHDTLYKILYYDTDYDPISNPYVQFYIDPILTHDVANGETCTTICGDYSEDEVQYDSGWFDGVSRIYDYGSLFYGHPSYYSGKPTAEDRALYKIPIVKTFDPVVARYWHFEVDNVDNADGVIRIARALVARGNQPTIGLAPGSTSQSWISNTKVSTTNNMRRLYRSKKNQRQMPVMFKDLARSEAYGTFFDLQGRLDTHKQFYWITDPSDTSLMHQRSFLATFENLNPIQYPYAYGVNDVPLNILEVI